MHWMEPETAVITRDMKHVMRFLKFLGRHIELFYVTEAFQN